MLQFVGRRLLSMLIASVAIVFFGFLGMHLIAEPESSAAERVGLGTAVLLSGQDTADFFTGVATGSLGEVPTVSGPRPVSEILWFSYKNSMALLLLSLLAATLIGLLVGTMAALTRRRRREYTLLLLTIAGVSAPSFFVAVLLQQAGIKYTVTVGSRLVSMGGFGWDFQHMALPLLVLAARPVAYLTRSSYISLQGIMAQDYIRTAFSKGLSTPRTVLVHALKNLAVPLLTAVGVSLRFSLSALPLVEFIFAWPGMGQRILEAINDHVPLLVVSIALTIGLTIQLISFLLDFTYRFIDPRVREGT